MGTAMIMAKIRIIRCFLVAIALLILASCYVFLEPFKRFLVKHELKYLSKFAISYRTKSGRWPLCDELKVHSALLYNNGKDPWGNELILRSDDESFYILSCGSDHVPSTKDDTCAKIEISENSWCVEIFSSEGISGTVLYFD